MPVAGQRPRCLSKMGRPVGSRGHQQGGRALARGLGMITLPHADKRFIVPLPEIHCRFADYAPDAVAPDISMLPSRDVAGVYYALILFAAASHLVSWLSLASRSHRCRPEKCPVARLFGVRYACLDSKKVRARLGFASSRRCSYRSAIGFDYCRKRRLLMPRLGRLASERFTFPR